MTCHEGCPVRTGRIAESVGEPKKLGDILGLPDDAAEEMQRLSMLAPKALQSAIPELSALMCKHPTMREKLERAREAIAAQHPDIAETIGALEQGTVDPTEQLALLETLHAQNAGMAAGSIIAIAGDDRSTPELLQRAVTQTPVNMVVGDEVLLANVILYCDGCKAFFKIGNTWHGCTHHTLCDACHSQPREPADATPADATQ